MARPTKQGLDYFPLDTSMDSKMELFEAEHGLTGFAFLIKLFQKIYDNGYFCEWNEDEQLLFSKRINVDINRVNVYINSALSRNIFSQELFDKYKILTSRGIQKRFIEACKRRKQIEITREICLIDFDELQYRDLKNKIVYVSNNSINVNINSVEEELMLHDVNNNSQKKEEESKVKESKVEEIENILYDADAAKIQKILIETIGSMNTTVIQEAIEYLKDLPLEVIEHALKKTARKGAKWDYAQSILNDYVSKELKTLEAIEADEIAFKNKKQVEENNTNKKQFQNYDQREYKNLDTGQFYANKK